MKSGALLLLLSSFFLALTGCNQAQGNNHEEKVDYEETKKMVVDIIKSEDGKKAFQEVLADPKMREQFVLDDQLVTNTIEKNFTTDKSKSFWQKNFSDPKFASAYAKSLKGEHEQLLKDLMKDPAYRKQILGLMQDPQLSSEYLKVLQSQKYRESVQKVMLETMDSPLFKVKMQDIIVKAAEEMPASKPKGGGAQQGGGQAAGGQSGGGGQ
ncbi:spore germination protein D [Peribacillus deserti]|uniref:Spore germination protein D n=1 Tax=Peribacillus deserti TaxID=673318 RepID=A0ABS2QNU6_9BACI|nr:spore germination lipoprotein GerD [Peribacillus deserti]MBM7694835.1 spore germination protein D [Peribacillus deserti]